LARAHLLPLLARLGPYDTALMDRATGRAPRRIMETWAHEATYVPTSTFPLLTWKRRRWPGMNPETLEAEHSDLFALIRQVVTSRGPLRSGEIGVHVGQRYTQRDNSKWGWSCSPANSALEILFEAGELTSARRSRQFERVYRHTERVLP